MKRLVPLLLLSAATAALADAEHHEPPHTKPTPAIDADEWLTRAAYLASDDLAGRESGTAGGHLAEEYVAAEFARLGLEPLGADGSFFQDVPMPTRTPDPENSWVAFRGPDDPVRRLGAAADCVPFAFSAAGEVTGELAFAGFGLTDPKSGYDDYVGLDARGKVLLILRHGPGEADVESPTSPRGPRAREMAQLQAFTAKASRAVAAGAAAVLIVNDYNHEQDGLPVSIGGEESAVPVLVVSRTVAEELLAGTGATLRELQTAIDTDRTPRSQVFAGRQVTATAAVHAESARNVVAIRRGVDPELRAQAVVLCAHMDHVGLGWFGSPVGGGQIHNGADDNASGTASILEAAEWLASRPAPRRSIVLAGWCGEEKGLIGSRHYVDHPLVPLADTVVCVNLDMVGRYRTEGPQDGGLFVGGAATGTGLDGIVERLAGEESVRVTDSWTAWEQSDHYAFYAARVPSLFLTTGLHPQYHRPTDDWWLLNAPGAVHVTTLAARLALTLADADTRPEFVERPPRPILGVRLADAGGREGALMGTVFPGTSAARAGIQSGDVVIAWNGAPVRSASDLGEMIGRCAVGDDVNVGLLRGDKALTVQVTLGAPPQRGPRGRRKADDGGETPPVRSSE